MRRGYKIGLLLTAMAALSLIVVVYATHLPEHNKEGDCTTCHLNDPETVPPGDSLLFTEDIVQICARCHPGATTLSHPIGSTVTEPLPPEFPLDWKGETTCTTCHFFHDEQYPYFMRSGYTGKEFCLQCHTMNFFDQMLDGGESLVEAHLLTGLEVAVQLGYIDPLSLDCLGCHDGVTASEVRISVSEGGVIQHSASSAHPIGTDYAEYSNFDTSVEPISSLPPEILLVDGKMGCPSCHVPYDTVHGALVITQQGSKLCFTCHRM